MRTSIKSVRPRSVLSCFDKSNARKDAIVDSRTALVRSTHARMTPLPHTPLALSDEGALQQAPMRSLGARRRRRRRRHRAAGRPLHARGQRA